MASSSYKQYNSDVPSFLHNRPTQLVKHLMQRRRSSKEISSSDIKRSDKTFFVKSSSTEQIHQVQFVNKNLFPQCSCADFTKFFLPCKHMFAIFNHFSDISWRDLPQWYRNSPYMTLDEEIVDVRNNDQNVLPLPIDQNTVTTIVTSISSHSDFDVQQNTKCKDVPKPNNTKNKSIKRINALLAEIQNLCFDTDSTSALNLAEDRLKEVVKNLKGSCNYDAGLRLTNEKSAAKKIVNRKRKSTFVCNALPRKYPKYNRFSGRVGHVANTFKRLHSVTGLSPATPCHTRKLRVRARKNVDTVSKSKLENISDLGKSKSVKCQDFLLRKKIDVDFIHIQDHSGLQPSSLSLTPHVTSVKGKNMAKCILNNGPHSLSLIQIKSLEPLLSRNELAILKVHDPDFNTGWLYDAIIDSFLWCLCEQIPNCLYASSAIAQILENGSSIHRLWKDVSFCNKKWLFMPWNPTRVHWILIAVDLVQQKMIFLDPKENSNAEHGFFIELGKELINNLLRNKFGFAVSSVESPNKILQQDFMSCGVFVCWYAYVLARGKNLDDKFGLLDFRKHIYETVAGGCLKFVKCGNSTCIVCGQMVAAVDEIKTCIRCNRKIHKQCCKLDKQVCSDETFTCPL